MFSLLTVSFIAILYLPFKALFQISGGVVYIFFQNLICSQEYLQNSLTEFFLNPSNVNSASHVTITLQGGKEVCYPRCPVTIAVALIVFQVFCHTKFPCVHCHRRVIRENELPNGHTGTIRTKRKIFEIF